MVCYATRRNAMLRYAMLRCATLRVFLIDWGGQSFWFPPPPRDLILLTSSSDCTQQMLFAQMNTAALLNLHILPLLCCLMVCLVITDEGRLLSFTLLLRARI